MEIKNKKNILLLLTIGIFLIGITSASLGTFKSGECIQIVTNSNSSAINISGITSPSPLPEIIVTNKQMTKSGNFFNYTFCNTTKLGSYTYGYCDNLGNCYSNDFEVTETGDSFGIPQALLLFGQFGLISLFFGMGFTFKQEKWKLRSFFFMSSLLMGVIFLNSIRIIIGTSTNLTMMGTIGLILGIVVLSFMFLYLLISYTIEMFGYFKERSKMKWKISEQ